MSRRLADLLLNRPGLPIAVLLLVVVVSLGLLPRLGLEAGLDVFLDPGSEYQHIVDRVDEHFVSDDIVFVVYEAPDIFSHDALELIRELGHRFEEIAVGDPEAPEFLVDEVTSLATVDTLVGSTASFRTVPLVPDPTPTEAVDLEQIRARAFDNPIIRGGLVSEDGRVGCMALRLEPGLDAVDKAELVSRVRAIVAEVDTDGVQLFPLGEAVTQVDTAAYQGRDLMRFIPLAYLLLMVALYLFLRRVLGVALAAVNMTLSMGAGTALLTLVGSKINNCSVMLPPVVTALSVATIVHYFSEYGKNGLERGGADVPRLTLRELLPPVFMASLTTGIAFTSLAVSKIPAIHTFGLASGATMLVAFAIATSVVALAWRRWSPDAMVSIRGIALSSVFDGFLRRLAELIIRRRVAVLICSTVVAGATAIGMKQLHFDQNNIEFFAEDAPVRRAHAFMSQHLGGSTVLVVSIETAEPGRFLEPDELRKLEALHRFLRAKGADEVTSVLSYLELMHRELYDGDPERHRIPDTREQASQLMLLNGDPTVDEFIDEGRRWVRITARHPELQLARMVVLFEEIDAYLAANFPANQGYHADATGRSRLWASMLHELVSSQVFSLSVSMAVIFALMFLLFRSVPTGLYSIPPNLLPIVFVLGLMGWTDMDLNASTVMIATVALGIAVDDTIHFLQHYRSRLADHGDIERAVRETFHTKGPAIITTSLVISIGFSVVLISSFVPTRDFGLLIILAMITALIGDLMLLPALLLVTRTRLGLRG